MRDQDDYTAIGRALGALLGEAASKESLRPGLEALGRLIAAALAQPGCAAQAPVAEVLVELQAAFEPEPVAETMVEAAAEVPIDVGKTDVETTTPAEPEPTAAETVAPAMAHGGERTDLGRMIEEAFRNIANERREPGPAVPAEVAPSGIDLEGDDTARDAELAIIDKRIRLRAALARAAAESNRTGAPVDDELIHDTRSAGGTTWLADLPDPDPAALDAVAACLDATADAADLWLLLGRHGIRERGRRTKALYDLAAVQSALRVAVQSLREADDEDQIAVYRWLKDTTWAYQIYVGRHMTIDDPLDPGQVGEVVGLLQEDLQELRVRTERQTVFKKRLGALRYHAGRLDQGKGDDHDLDKIVECSVALVEAGMPPSSLDLRTVLLPVFDLLPEPEGRDVRYGRVIVELQAELDRAAEEAEASEAGPVSDATYAKILCPSDAVALARRNLPGVVIPDSAIDTIGEIDGAEEARAWGRSTWRALRALDAFSQEAASYRGFWDWCATSGHHHAWPATSKKLAINESATVMRGELRDDRVFGVDVRVSADGEMLMPAHCKIAEGGGRLSPRLYFHDDTKGTTRKVHVGFIGPHRRVPNTSTN